MLNALDKFWRINEVIIPFALDFSVYKGVPFGGCGCINSMSVTQTGHARCTVMNMPPIFHSAAEAMMFLIFRHMM